MTKMNMINEKELNNVSGGFNPAVIIPYIPTIIDGVKKIFGKGDSKTQTQTQTQPTTVTNGPTFKENQNGGDFKNNTNATNYIASNNGNMNGNQTVGC